jgi:hypothetical protein
MRSFELLAAQVGSRRRIFYGEVLKDTGFL